MHVYTSVWLKRTAPVLIKLNPPEDSIRKTNFSVYKCHPSLVELFISLGSPLSGSDKATEAETATAVKQKHSSNDERNTVKQYSN